jgi:GTP cyclohydrolase I
MPIDHETMRRAALDTIKSIKNEDPKREGLEDTPKRIALSYRELLSGYDEDLSKTITTFDSDGYNELILLKNIEIYSLCEHHMLPFFGKAHVAYIPSDKIIGISKLARIVDIFAKRLQIQERVGEQVVKALVDYLKPIGAACIIEAEHLCMRMRGVEKQNSVMITSSLAGIFLEKTAFGIAARQELMMLIKD